ncbi:MAG: hypothetical protein MUF15_22055, partial [Acidobacteria bacterium]|nr:hypothetical protein [Acidobacteriota bacterium]
MDLFFNELSIIKDTEKNIAKQWMFDLVHVFKKAFNMGFKELKTTEAFRTFSLAPGYLINDWLNDPQVDYDTRLFAKTKASQAPFIDRLMDQKDNQDNRLHEFKYNRQKASGLGAAFLFETIALSFANSSDWKNHWVNLQVFEYKEDDYVNPGIEETFKEVNHASTLIHLDLLENWIIQ